MIAGMAGVSRRITETEVREPLRELITRPVTLITATTAGGAQVLLTVPDDKDFQVGWVGFCNVTASAATASLHIVPSGGSAGNGNLVIGAESVAGNNRLTLGERFAWLAPAGSTIEVHSGTTNALTVQLWGVLISGGDPL